MSLARPPSKVNVFRKLFFDGVEIDIIEDPLAWVEHTLGGVLRLVVGRLVVFED